jgi:hypothetical protein
VLICEITSALRDRASTAAYSLAAHETVSMTPFGPETVIQADERSTLNSIENPSLNFDFSIL